MTSLVYVNGERTDITVGRLASVSTRFARAPADEPLTIECTHPVEFANVARAQQRTETIFSDFRVSVPLLGRLRDCFVTDTDFDTYHDLAEVFGFTNLVFVIRETSIDPEYYWHPDYPLAAKVIFLEKAGGGVVRIPPNTAQMYIAGGTFTAVSGTADIVEMSGCTRIRDA